ncbi:MAG TPA: glycoside hydrolase family 3 C-terminal domain-containing protein [Acidobacteriaceae bacterium]|nr:glycoside hydrolase family 3 C-terminal domain-containing protein [Acidobacteriaceae bacterium]
MKIPAIALALTFCCGAASAQQSGAPLYLDPSKPMEQRITDLVSRMTLEEKASQLNHLNTGIPRLNVPAWGGWNQTLHGVWSKEPTTLFPAAIAMGATWDTPLVLQIAGAMSDEARALYNIGADGPRSKHGLVYRSPVINVSRDPRWGRIQEVFSEDPYMTGRMGVAYIQGLQGSDPRYLKVAATVKHFAVNNVETNRQRLSASVDERNLMEYWLPHWKAAIVEGHAQSVMASYNAINGAPDAVNKYLLTDILRGKWGFDGFVTDDLGGVNLLVNAHHITEDPVEATARAIQAGCDSDDAQFQTNIPLAVRSGRLPIADVDRAVGRVLRVGFRLGVFDPPESNPYSKISASVIRSPEHLNLALQTALESMTLLTNRRDFLPLKKGEVKSIAVIGPAGNSDYETGNYYGKPARKVSPVQGLKDLLGAGVDVQYEQGAGFVEPADPAAIARAAELARKSDVALVFLGTNLKVEAEGHDRRDLNLPGAQEQLLEAVYAANPKTVLVLMNAGPLAVTWANDHLPAILDAWYPGEAGGAAIASVLFGDYNPGGRLPYTVYASLDGVPPQNEYDVSKGFTYLYFKGVPLYSFGHGLSYTRFKYENLKLSSASISPAAPVEVSFDLKNVGERAGSDVPQLYVHQVKSTVVQPIKSLRGFERVNLQPGESKHIAMSLQASALSYYDVHAGRFVVEPGIFDVMVGASSEDIRLRAQLKVAQAGR